MNKVLYYCSKSCFEPTNYTNFDYEFRKIHNAGNKLFQYSVEKFFRENNVEYKCTIEPPEIINNTYNKVVITPANIFGKHAKKQLKFYTDFISKLKVPVYFLSCGIQKTDDISIKDLTKEIGTLSKKLINAVYETGGEFALRGNITKEFFNAIVPSNTATVTGCPAMYMFKNLQIPNIKVSYSEFKPLINGTITYIKQKNISKIFDEFPNSEYFDQDEFTNVLLKDLSNVKIEELLEKYSYIGTKLLAQNRIKFFYDIPVWMNYIIDNNFNFSFGSRIHGNIISILCKIPAVVNYKDDRVKEICEFYDIPCFKDTDKEINLYDIYLNADYNKFNQNFEKHYNNYVNFMKNCGFIGKTNKINKLEEAEFLLSTPVNDTSYIKHKLANFNTKAYIKREKLFKLMHAILLGKARRKMKNKYILVQELKHLSI